MIYISSKHTHMTTDGVKPKSLSERRWDEYPDQVSELSLKETRNMHANKG